MIEATHDLLSMPYTRIFRAADENDFTSEVMEFPGCFATGDTAEEAMENLEEAMVMWVEAERETGHDIPESLVLDEYSGRMTLRIPSSLHQRAALEAQREEVSLSRLLSAAVASYVGSQPSATDQADVAPGWIVGLSEQGAPMQLSATDITKLDVDDAIARFSLRTTPLMPVGDNSVAWSSDGASITVSGITPPGYRDVIATDPVWGQQFWDREHLQSESPVGRMLSLFETAEVHWRELVRLLEGQIGAAAPTSPAKHFPETDGNSLESDPNRPTP